MKVRKMKSLRVNEWKVNEIIIKQISSTTCDTNKDKYRFDGKK